MCATYKSQNRIVPQPVGHIEQPKHKSTQPQFFQRKTDTVQRPVITVNSTFENGSLLAETVKKLVACKYRILPEITTMPDLETMEDLALVLAYSGYNPTRYFANEKALSRIMHSQPRPKLIVFVEYVTESETPYYRNREWIDHYILKTISKDQAAFFQKEIMWTDGTRYAFSQEGITKCICLDIDCAFEDNSWAYYTSMALNHYDFIQPFAGMYYSDQPDRVNMYGKDGIHTSVAYELVHNRKGVGSAPGGTFACTKKFFEKSLGNSWPVSSVGSGDVMFWRTIFGTKLNDIWPRDYDARLRDTANYFSEVKVGYANNIMIHFYHGPMNNRMYGTRTYLLNKCKASVVSDDGIIDRIETGNKSPEDKMLLESFDMLKKITREKVSQNITYTQADLKPEFRKFATNFYGKITSSAQLCIVTSCRSDVLLDVDSARSIYASVKAHCMCPFKFIIITDRKDLDFGDEIIEADLPKIKCPDIWNRLYLFKRQYTEDESVLFIDHNVMIVRDFNINICPSDRFYMLRPFGQTTKYGRLTWDASMMFFKGSSNLKNIYDTYEEDIMAGGLRDPEYQFIDPSEYITAGIRQNTSCMLANIVAHVDYNYSDNHTPAKLSDFVISPL